MGNKTSIYQQILLNALPVIGYWFWGWSMFAIVYLYWVEAVIISFFVFLKISLAKGVEPSTGAVATASSRIFSGLRILLLRLGILVFYWVFILIFVALGQGKYSTEVAIDNTQILAFVNPGFNLAVLAFFLSQIVEFVSGFILNDMYKTVPSSQYRLFFDARTIIIHVVVVLGTFAYQFLDRYAAVDNRLPGLGFVLVLFFIKSIADVVVNSRVFKSTTSMSGNTPV